MATTTNIQDLFKTYVGNSKDNNPHDEGQRKFEKKHITDKKVQFDPKLGAKNDQFQPDKVKVIDREKTHHGYNVGKDQQVYAEETEELAEGSVSKDGYYVTNHMSELSHPADKPFVDSKTAIRHAMKKEDQTSRVHTVTHVKGGKINKQWQGESHAGQEWGFHPYDDYKGEPFWHKGPSSVKEEVELDEKHLTPAEMKKREEVAKAMERENPGMDKSKKMAIATATAKKVAEDVEQIDELSKNKLQKYDNAARQSIDDLRWKSRGEYNGPDEDPYETPESEKAGKKLDSRENMLALAKAKKNKSGATAPHYTPQATAKVRATNEETMHGASCTCSSCMTKRGKRMTKEDVINSTIARFMPEDFTPPTLEEKFTRAIEGLSEQMALTLVGLYESLNTDNQEEMVAQMSTKEGMNKLIDFAINSRGE